MFTAVFELSFIQREYFFKAGRGDPFIIDCGANTGEEIFYFKYLYPRAKILAFEPDNQTFAVLQKNIEENNFKDIKLVNSALGAGNKTAAFYFDQKDPGSGLMSLYPTRWHRDQKTVKVVTLSSYINSKVDYLKIDIEGAETQVINDLYKNGKLKFVEKMIVEYHHHVEKNTDNLSVMLKILEKEGFGYQLSTPLKPPYRPHLFQDLMIFCYKK